MHIGGIIYWGCLAREIENQTNFPLDFGFSATFNIFKEENF
jgi:hypothetical protein